MKEIKDGVYVIPVPKIIKTVEFCYKNNDGSISVRYRRDEGTVDCVSMQREIETMKAKWGNECRYFYRSV